MKRHYSWMIPSVLMVVLLAWTGAEMARGEAESKAPSSEDLLTLTQSRLDLESLEKQLAQVRTKFLLDERQLMTAIDSARQAEEKTTKTIRAKYSKEGYELFEKQGKWGLIARPKEEAKK